MAHVPEILARDIFGGSDSELSSDDDDEELQQQQQQRPIARRPSPLPPSDYSSADDGDSADEYHQRAPKALKRKKAARRKSDADPTDPDQELVRKRKRTQQRAPAKRRREPPEIDLTELPPDQANKIRLDMQIEAILKPKKAARQKKRKKGDAEDDEVLDRFADEEVSRLRDAMMAAAQEDDAANKEKLPATAKLRLLGEVVEVLRKAALAQSIVDNNLLQGVRRWLEPLPDRSLPALNIQRDFFPLLRRMEFIDSAVLKESGLGKVVLFYTKSRRATADVRRIANELVSTWSRPIIKRSASYRDRVVPTFDDAGGAATAGGAGSGRAGERLNAILARAKEGEKGRVRKNAVMIPQRELGSYTVAPRVNAGIGRGNVSVDVDVERRRKNAERLRSLTRKVANKG